MLELIDTMIARKELFRKQNQRLRIFWFILIISNAMNIISIVTQMFLGMVEDTLALHTILFILCSICLVVSVDGVFRTERSIASFDEELKELREERLAVLS